MSAADKLSHGTRYDWSVLDPKLREMVAARWTQRKIAKALGCSQVTVGDRMRELGLGGAPRAKEALTFDPPKGRMPALNYLVPDELQIDPAYQRSIEGQDSQRLITRIAKRWDWAKCLPLLVSDRGEGGMFVVDGQHRLTAAKLRGDIQQLPCVVVMVGGQAGEAALFGAVNSQRRALTPLELFRAALASGDPETAAILDAIHAAGLSLAPQENTSVWKPGMISHVGGIRQSWQQYGAATTSAALAALAEGFSGQVLRYGGTLFAGLPRLVAEGHGARLAAVLATRSQDKWRADLMRARAKDPGLNWKRASHQVIGAALAPKPSLAASAFVGGKAWCSQCEMRVTEAEARGCKSRYCSLKRPVAA
jgi:hypothetical protein